ncbi:MAG: hypothetical protein BGN82_07910 [Alphaproteobacteria bacterium 65-7]|nr:MAG: hypothetical protein BGN82_07910 [Alphaproteobacteria bacterium 65-7]
MRFSLFSVLAAAPPSVLAALLLTSAPALAVQDQPIRSGDIEAVCTGVGSAKDDPRWTAYPVKIVLATQNGANLANAHITLSKEGRGKGGQAAMQFDCDAPWVLVKAPPGSYSATATLVRDTTISRSVNFSTSGSGPQRELTLMFPVPAATAAN